MTFLTPPSLRFIQFPGITQAILKSKPPVQNEILKKKLLYRSTHRGCKEMDLMLSTFIKSKIDSFEPDGLALLDDFINENELEIMEWIIESKNIPSKYNSLVKKIVKFNRQ